MGQEQRKLGQQPQVKARKEQGMLLLGTKLGRAGSRATGLWPSMAAVLGHDSYGVLEYPLTGVPSP